MDTNRKVFRNPSPTLRAELRSIFSGNFSYFSPSFRRFEAKYAEELKPSYISHRPIEAMVVAIPRVHLFNEDSIVLSNQLIGNFEVEVLSLISHLFVGFGNKDSGFSSSMRTFNPTRESLLSLSECILSLLKEARIFYLLAIRGSKERFTANINADTFTSFRQRFFSDIITGEGNKPLISGCPTNGNCFNVSLNEAGKLELESAYFVDIKILALKSPACLLQGKAIVPVSTLETGKPSFLITVLNPAEEASVGFIQSLQHFLENLRAYLSVFWKGSFKFRELFYLLIERNRTMVLLVDSDTLFKSSIVEVSTEVKPMFSLVDSQGIRLDAILKRLFHLPCTKINIAHPEKEGKPHRASLSVSPALKCGVLDSGS